jgi:AraC-like DNA-binding protein
MQRSTSVENDISPSANASLHDLCERLFREPQRLFKAHMFGALNSIGRQQGPHAHDDILQLDLALSCSGRWVVDGRSYPVQGDTLAVFYPHQVHSYELQRDKESSRVLSIKLQIESGWPAVRQRVFTAHSPGLERGEALIHTWDRLIRLSAWSALHPHRAREPLVTAHLCEVLCRFPTEHAPSRFDIDNTDSVVEEALLLLERRLQRPLQLEELAAAVHLSPRQLSRRFLNAIGQTPQQYANGLRLLAARDLVEEQTPAAEVARHLGFSSVQAFSRWFKKHNGVALRATRRSGMNRPPL